MFNEIVNELEASRKVLDDFMNDKANILAIQKAADIMINCLKNGGKIIACGNGGSMSDAMHFASELTGRYRENRRPLPAIAISDPGHISCVGNDFSYSAIFSRFIMAHGKKDDVLLAISTSGDSANVDSAISAAIQSGMDTVLLTGNYGGVMLRKLNIGRSNYNTDTGIIVPHYGTADRIQEVHIKVIHILVMLIEKGVLGE